MGLVRVGGRAPGLMLRLNRDDLTGGISARSVRPVPAANANANSNSMSSGLFIYIRRTPPYSVRYLYILYRWNHIIFIKRINILVMDPVGGITPIILIFNSLLRWMTEQRTMLLMQEGGKKIVQADSTSTSLYLALLHASKRA